MDAGRHAGKGRRARERHKRREATIGLTCLREAWETLSPPRRVGYPVAWGYFEVWSWITGAKASVRIDRTGDPPLHDETGLFPRFPAQRRPPAHVATILPRQDGVRKNCIKISHCELERRAAFCNAHAEALAPSHLGEVDSFLSVLSRFTIS